ncbi:amidohydrolase [Pseudomonas aeruginosa]|nr:amidohydrolase [Pseudomonas aeruginosa]MBG7044183.1 amidohydrolase [Pseudomonas aeruginosa]
MTLTHLLTRKRFMVPVLALLVFASLLSVREDSAPDLIFLGGPILTVNPSDDVAQALAIRDGVITAIGTEKDVLARKGANTELVDLRGSTLLPGFVGAHEHPGISAVFNGAINLSGLSYKTNAEVWNVLRREVAKVPKGQWIYAGGLDAILTPDLQIPHRKELDALAPDNPLVLVSQTLHSFWANSKAFEAAGITRNTQDPGAGSYYERDAQGELTGFVAETRAAQPLLVELKSPWKIYSRYVDVLDGLLSSGFTTVASLGYNVPPLLARVAASHNFNPRIRQFFYLTENELDYLPSAPDSSDPYFAVLGIKLWHDGSPYTGSMYTTQPYLDSKLGRQLGIRGGTHGSAMLSERVLTEKLRSYSAHGWQIAIHSQGDASNRAVLQSVAKAGALPGQVPVVRMEHGVFMMPDSVRQAARLGVSPSFHIHHIKYYGDALANSLIGLAAAQQTLPVRSAFALGMRPTLHADSPMFPPKGFGLMQTAISRTTDRGLVLNQPEGLTVQQALRAMTINGALQLRRGDKTGSLEVGKWADLQIVNGNPYTTPIADLDRIRTLAVYVGGKLQFKADGK